MTRLHAPGIVGSVSKELAKGKAMNYITNTELATAREMADKCIAGRGGNLHTESLWWAWGALDSVILTVREERVDYARKDALMRVWRKAVEVHGGGHHGDRLHRRLPVHRPLKDQHP